MELLVLKGNVVSQVAMVKLVQSVTLAQED
jgi:hypothetical protein